MTLMTLLAPMLGMYPSKGTKIEVTVLPNQEDWEFVFFEDGKGNRRMTVF